MEKERFNSAETMDETPSSETDSVGDQAERKSPTSADPALCPFLAALPPVVVVTGHYGVGKTNLTLNMAFDRAAAGFAVTVVDLDVVNPYFRSSDHAEAFAQAGIELVAPLYAGTTLDSPGLSGRVSTVVQQAYEDPTRRRVLVDAGGDDVGATALGRFSGAVQAGDHAVLFVVNERRNLTQTPGEAAAIMAEVQAKSRLSVSGVIGNTHLQTETSDQIVLEAVPFSCEVARSADVPLWALTAPRWLAGSFGDDAWRAAAEKTEYGIYPVDVRVCTPWDSAR